MIWRYNSRWRPPLRRQLFLPVFFERDDGMFPPSEHTPYCRRVSTSRWMPTRYACPECVRMRFGTQLSCTKSWRNISSCTFQQAVGVFRALGSGAMYHAQIMNLNMNTSWLCGHLLNINLTTFYNINQCTSTALDVWSNLQVSIFPSIECSISAPWTVPPPTLRLDMQQSSRLRSDDMFAHCPPHNCHATAARAPLEHVWAVLIIMTLPLRGKLGQWN